MSNIFPVNFTFFLFQEPIYQSKCVFKLKLELVDDKLTFIPQFDHFREAFCSILDQFVRTVQIMPKFNTDLVPGVGGILLVFIFA